ncbi:MAG: exonuclease SbcCD subunit D [Paracoccaceae bacterium]
MPSFRFIHSSDLHLGRRFGTFPPEIRGRLVEARHGAIGRLAGAARSAGAAHVVLAGDIFDSATPSDPVLRQAVNAMREAHDLTWWLLPGNHDNLAEAEPLWEELVRDAPENLRPLTRAEPRKMADGVALLPAPVTHRYAGHDLTGALDAMESPEGTIRLGLAHGGVVDFADTGATIPPDRAARAGLDYLALGDWHGRLEISGRTHYSGSPEQDRFRHDRRGVCLAVTLEEAGAPPRIEEVETGTFLWADIALPLLPDADAAAALAGALPEARRRDTLLRVRAEGRARLAGHRALEEAAEAVAPDFWYFALNTDALATEHDAADLDAIDRAGALRLAAQALMDEAGDETRDSEARAVAEAALVRLYGYVAEGAA